MRLCGSYFRREKIFLREVDTLSNDIAAFLLSKNISVGDVASILIPRCAFMPIAALGALKAGCTYQPLDSTYPPERLNFMVKDTAAKVLITPQELRSTIYLFCCTRVAQRAFQKVSRSRTKILSRLFTGTKDFTT